MDKPSNGPQSRTVCIERKLEVFLDPHPQDNLNAPYFWVVMEHFGMGWCNSGLCG